MSIRYPYLLNNKCLYLVKPSITIAIAGGVGIEPTFRVPETRCLPLADPPI